MLDPILGSFLLEDRAHCQTLFEFAYLFLEVSACLRLLSRLVLLKSELYALDLMFFVIGISHSCPNYSNIVGGSAQTLNKQHNAKLYKMWVIVIKSHAFGLGPLALSEIPSQCSSAAFLEYIL